MWYNIKEPWKHCLSERNQWQRTRNYMIPFAWDPEQANPWRQSTWMAAKGWGGGGNGEWQIKNGDESGLRLMVIKPAQLCKYTKNQYILHAYMLSRFSHVRLCMTLPGSSVHGILQARILEWVAMPSSSRESSWSRDQTRIFCVSCIGRQFLYHWR